jgi:A/G-specific adenine glycosylase
MQDFSTTITDWYRHHRRDLPWRNTQNPYLIWISEIILQQTRVAQGLDYYKRFVEHFPDVLSLAEADEEEVLKYWQGLGYYSRARNLHSAARQIRDNHRGIFPNKYEDVLALKGVGDYTAAAICSFAYAQPYAVLDCNVYRVLSRIFGIETPINTPKAKKEFSQLAQNLLNCEQPALHNSAMMDFGALQCLPSSPDCPNCPFVNQCIAFASGRVKDLPVKEKKNAVKERFFHYFYVQNADTVYIRKRAEQDIWKNLYEFPLIETAAKTTTEDLIAGEAFQHLFGSISLHIKPEPHYIKHILTHRIIHANFYSIDLPDENTTLNAAFLRVHKDNLEQYPVSRLVEMFLEKCFLK